MLADQTLSNFSDLMFRTSFVIYAIALIVALVFYVKMQSVIDAHRQRELVGADGRVADGRDADGNRAADGRAADENRDADAGASGKTADELEAGARKWSGMAQTLIWLGIIVQAGAAVTRGMATNRVPFGNMYEYSLMLTLLTMIVAAVAIGQRQEWRVLWPWLLIPVVILMFVGGSHLYAESAPLLPALRSFWLPIHVGIVVLGGSIGMLSGVASLLYLLRRWQPKGQESDGFVGAIVKPLPSAKKLDGLAYKSAIVTLPVLGL